jgi:transcriptional regulator with XRE-family HTH domain
MERQTIRALRRAKVMTQRELAEAMCCNVMSVYHWESGRNEPSARQLRTLAQVFGVPMEGIAFEKDAARTDRATEGEHGN